MAFLHISFTDSLISSSVFEIAFNFFRRNFFLRGREDETLGGGGGASPGR